MKKLSTKSVAGILFSILLCGFLSFGVAQAAQITAPRYSCNWQAVGIGTIPLGKGTFVYLGGTNWALQSSSGGIVANTQINNTVLTGSSCTPPLNLSAPDPNSQTGASYAAEEAAWDSPSNPAQGNGSAQTQSSNNAGTPTTGFFGFLAGAVNSTLGFLGGSAMTIIADILEFAIIPLVSVFLAIAGKILDFAVQYSIFGSGFTDFNGTIQTVWALTRDVCNVFFIFILLYIAIRKIINETGPDVKKMLTAVIISALFINFSLFGTGVVIDAGNIVATALLNQIEAPGILSTSTAAINSVNSSVASGITGIKTNIQLSETIMDSLKLENVYQAGTGAAGTALLNTGTTGFIESILRLVLFSITTFVFIFMALLLIGRFVMLIFLMATAPIGFIGGSIPFLEDASKGWRDELLNQVLVAPIFMFFMYLIILVSQHLLTLPANAIVPTSDTVGQSLLIYFDYIFIIYLLIKAVKITKSFSGDIGKLANQAATGLTGLALGAATGGTSLALRQTVGRGAAALANNDSLKKSASNGNILSRLALRASTGTAKSSLDIRNTGVAKGTLGFVKDEGIDLTGKPPKALEVAKDGFVGGKERAVKAETKFAKDQLGRGDLTEEQALKEHEDKTKDYKSDIASLDQQIKKVKEYPVTDEDPETKKILADKLAKLEGERSEKNSAVELAEKANATDEYGNKTAEAGKAREEILKQAKKSWQSQYATTLENSVVDTVFRGHNKEAAAKIRKDLKEKTDEEKLAELAIKVQKEKTDKEEKEKGEKKDEKSEGEKPDDKSKDKPKK